MEALRLLLICLLASGVGRHRHGGGAARTKTVAARTATAFGAGRTGRCLA